MKISFLLVLLTITSGLIPSFADQQDLTSLEGKAAKGDAQAELDLGRAYHLGKGVPKDFAKAADLYRQSAAQGNAKAMYNLGYIYQHGQGVSQDGPTAVQWFQKAADHGLTAAELTLGQAYYFGDMGLNKDYAAAAKWLKLAAEPKNESAQRNPAANTLGTLYEHGWGVPLDGQLAVSWYSKAAETGYDKAQSNLGRVYNEGRMVKRDRVQSYMWLKLAAFQAEPMATHLLPEYLAGKEYSAAEIAEGDRRIKEFQLKHHQPTNQTVTFAQDPEVPPAAVASPTAGASSNTATASAPNASSSAAPPGH